MKRLSTSQAAQVVGIDPGNAHAMLPELARCVGPGEATAGGARRTWTAGEVLAMAIVRALDPHGVNPDRWAPGARHVRDAHERGLLPAYLVTAGGEDVAIVLDGDGAERATAEIAVRVCSGGPAARVVPVAPIIEHLCDVLDLRMPA
jgi:hypothetical protein